MAGDLYRRATVLTVLAAWLVRTSLSIYAPSTPNEPPAYCTVFNHMVKSGGTTIKTQLEESSVAEGDQFPGLCTYGGGFDTPESCQHAVYNSSVITGYGELLRHPLTHLGRSCEYFTVMRHPISRLVSAFYFCPEDQPIDRPQKWCGNVPMEEFTITERLLDFAKSTIWTRVAFAEMFFGLRCPPGFALCDPSVKPIAYLKGIRSVAGRDALFRMQENLRSYKAVGIFEHWDLSMDLFDATVTSSVRDWNKGMTLNPGPTNPERQEVLNWAYMNPEIHSAMAADILLYQYSLSLFKRQTREVLGKVWDA